MVAANEKQHHIIKDSAGLPRHISRTLAARLGKENYFSNAKIDWHTSAGVIMLLGLTPPRADAAAEPCVVLNKRSLKVRQPGDLCFPGGSMASPIDPVLARLFSLPFGSLGRWHCWKKWRQGRRRLATSLSILWATGLRESLEEMRLNPFGVRFLGPLPPQSLVMFKRTIYPMVGWINRQKRFFPNWEVEKVVHLPLKNILNPGFYHRYRLRIAANPDRGLSERIQDYPCLRLPGPGSQEILWGATYRITIDFLRLVFDFQPPALETLPVVEGFLDETYLTGNK